MEDYYQAYGVIVAIGMMFPVSKTQERPSQQLVQQTVHTKSA